ncbi:MAG TPA: HK97 gp10 family phage protein [Chloroflexota bacterium]
MADELGLTIAFGQIERAAKGAREAARLATDSSALAQSATQVLLDALKAVAPVRTGTLRASIIARASGANGQGFYGLAYGKLLVDGTRPHVIVPRTKHALFWPGARHPVRRVQHPGTKPNRFPERAVQRSVPALRLLLRDDGRRLIGLLGGDAP